jgi:hypothetical protein
MPRKPSVPREAQDIGPALVREFEQAAIANRAIADLRSANEGLHEALRQASEGALVRYQQARDTLLYALRRGEGVVTAARGAGGADARE